MLDHFLNYFSIYIATVLIGVIPSYFLLRKEFGEFRKNKENRPSQERIRLIFEPKRLEYRKLIDSIEYRSRPIFLLSSLFLIFEWVRIIFVFPPMIIISAFHWKIKLNKKWSYPLSFEDAWIIVNIIISYHYASKCFSLSLLISSLVIISIFYELVSILSNVRGKARIFRSLWMRVNLIEFAANWSLLALGFASVYYSISVNFKDSFGRAISVQESIFYSFYALTNVREDYLTANSYLIKWISFSEVLMGYGFSIILVGIFLSVWVKHQDETPKE